MFKYFLSDFRSQEITIRNDSDFRLFHSNYYIRNRLNTIYIRFNVDSLSTGSQCGETSVMQKEHNYCRSTANESENSSNQNNQTISSHENGIQISNRMRLSQEFRNRIKCLSNSFVDIVSQLEEMATIVDKLSEDVKGSDAKSSELPTKMQDKSNGVKENDFIATETEPNLVNEPIPKSMNNVSYTTSASFTELDSSFGSIAQKQPELTPNIRNLRKADDSMNSSATSDTAPFVFQESCYGSMDGGVDLKQQKIGETGKQLEKENLEQLKASEEARPLSAATSDESTSDEEYQMDSSLNSSSISNISILENALDNLSAIENLSQSTFSIENDNAEPFSPGSSFESVDDVSVDSSDSETQTASEMFPSSASSSFNDCNNMLIEDEDSNERDCPFSASFGKSQNVQMEANRPADQSNQTYLSLDGSNTGENTADVPPSSSQVEDATLDSKGLSDKSILFLKICKHILSSSTNRTNSGSMSI